MERYLIELIEEASLRGFILDSNIGALYNSLIEERLYITNNLAKSKKIKNLFWDLRKIFLETNILDYLHHDLIDVENNKDFIKNLHIKNS